jgi:transcriptional regulator with XRE-family HTH domain
MNAREECTSIGASKSFRSNLRKILKRKNYTLANFAELVDMDVSKIQRFQDKKQNGAISLDDAEKIATALETSLGHMCDNNYNDFLLQKTFLLRELFTNRADQWRKFQIMTEKKHNMETEIVDYLEDILTDVGTPNRLDLEKNTLNKYSDT